MKTVKTTTAYSTPDKQSFPDEAAALTHEESLVQAISDSTTIYDLYLDLRENNKQEYFYLLRLLFPDNLEGGK